MSDVEIEQNEKLGTAAVVIGGVMLVGFFIAAVLLWVLPSATRNAVSGDALGLPFTGVGAVFLSMAGLLIARIGWRIRKGARAPHRVQPPLRRPSRPDHGEWTTP